MVLVLSIFFFPLFFLNFKLLSRNLITVGFNGFVLDWTCWSWKENQRMAAQSGHSPNFRGWKIAQDVWACCSMIFVAPIGKTSYTYISEYIWIVLKDYQGRPNGPPNNIINIYMKTLCMDVYGCVSEKRFALTHV